jgi:hypothetical protein
VAARIHLILSWPGVNRGDGAMIKVVAMVLTALMITAFMVRDREYEPPNLIMAAILWTAAVYLVGREWRQRRR